MRFILSNCSHPAYNMPTGLMAGQWKASTHAATRSSTGNRAVAGGVHRRALRPGPTLLLLAGCRGLWPGRGQQPPAPLLCQTTGQSQAVRGGCESDARAAVPLPRKDDQRTGFAPAACRTRQCGGWCPGFNDCQGRPSWLPCHLGRQADRGFERTPWPVASQPLPLAGVTEDRATSAPLPLMVRRLTPDLVRTPVNRKFSARSAA